MKALWFKIAVGTGGEQDYLIFCRKIVYHVHFKK